MLRVSLFYSNVTVSHDGIRMSQQARYWESETEAAKMNLANVNLNIYTCLFVLL